jgi:hypothetical protein
MRKLVAFVAVAALFAAAVPAAHAAKVPYKGKTTGGHSITFKYSKGKAHNVKTAVPVTCISIQGGGSPVTGVEPWTVGWMRTNLRDHKVTEPNSATGLHYREVTKNHTINTRRGRNGVISGSVRVQFSFLIPKFPIGTFAIYSCLGEMKFKARPAR